MVKPDIHAMHHQLESVGIPIRSVQLNAGGKSVSLLFFPTATDEQRQAAQRIADEWDQEAVEAAKAAAFDNLPSVEAINEAAKVAELKTMTLALRAYIDDHR